MIDFNDLLRYEEESGKLYWKKSLSNRAPVGKEAGFISDGYVRLSVNGKKYMAHKVVWAMLNGTYPEGDVDHINMIRSDNRISNLRLATRSQNFFNRPKTSRNTSGYKGVSARHGRWIAQISYNKKHKYLGIYNSKEEAYAAYCAASKIYHKEFSRV